MKNRLRVSEVHQDAVTEEFDRLSLIDLEELLAKKNQFVDTGCPACHGLKVVFEFDYQRLDYRRCADCGLLYISPAPTEEMHLDFVVNSRAMTYWRDQMPDAMRQSRRPMYKERVGYALDVMDRLKIPPHEILEVGAGNGEFAEELAAATDAVNSIVLLEPQALALDLPNLEIITGGFEELESSDRKFDAVFAWELIEHILEPDLFLQLVHKVLKSGCPLILSTPNERSVETGKLGIHSSNILFDHVRLYNPDAIDKMLTRNGFRVVEISTPGELDVERLQMFLRSHPEQFNDDPVLRFALTAAPAAQEAFQRFLQQDLVSSHMRVVAIPDGVWHGSSAPRLHQPNGPMAPDTAFDREGPESAIDPQTPDTALSVEAPVSFNKIVLGEDVDLTDPYPPKLMAHILFDLLQIRSGKFVDLGGGRGHLAKIVENLGFEVFSADREPPIIDVPFAVIDLINERLPLPDNSVDVLFSKSVFEHFYVRELPLLMSEALRVLKPGAPMVVLTPDWEYNMKQFYRVFTHVTPYTKDSLHLCLSMYGFDSIRVDNLIQLPQIWHNRALRLLSQVIGTLPLPRSLGKWTRWSKERSVIGIGRKPRG